jgi:hypothetical protein
MIADHHARSTERATLLVRAVVEILGTHRTTAGIISAGKAGTFTYYIAHGYFAYMALNFADTTALDHGLATELHHNPGYHTIAVVPYGTEVKPVGLGTYVIWKYEPRR